jgi:tetratricopeptide (TPR) repeat protein
VHLGNTLRAKKEWDAAIAAGRKVIELAPASPVGHYSLGISYAAKNQWNDAITAYQKAIELDPKLLGPHFGLGNAFAAKNQWNNAIAAYRQEIELDPKLPGPRVSLGNALNVKNQWDAAIVEFRKAIELDPISTSQHIGLGNALRWKNQVEAAAAEYRKAIELDPKLPLAYFNLAQLLRVHQRWKESIAPYRKAIELDPNYRDAHFGLGESLVKMGSFAQAKACIQLLQKLTPENDPDQERRRWLIQQVRRCDRGLEVEAKIPSILAGKLTMARGPEWREVVEICISQERYVTGAKIYELAFRAVPQMMDNLAIGHRYDAARLCAEAAAGEGVDAGKLDEKERAELRKQAIHWLRSELGSWDKFVASGNPNDRKLAREKLTERLRVPDLASIRDKDQLAKLSVDEREACEKLWRDVAALLKKLDE